MGPGQIEENMDNEEVCESRGSFCVEESIQDPLQGQAQQDPYQQAVLQVGGEVQERKSVNQVASLTGSDNKKN